jgi:hypothetical protein
MTNNRIYRDIEQSGLNDPNMGRDGFERQARELLDSLDELESRALSDADRAGEFDMEVL